MPARSAIRDSRLSGSCVLLSAVAAARAFRGGTTPRAPHEEALGTQAAAFSSNNQKLPSWPERMPACWSPNCPRASHQAHQHSPGAPRPSVCLSQQAKQLHPAEMMRPVTPLRRLFAALLVVLAPERCGSWHAHAIAGRHLQLVPRTAPCAVLQTDQGLTDAERQSEQVRAALQSLLPGYRQQAEEVEAAVTSKGPVAGTLAAQEASNDAQALAMREELLEEAYEQCR
eukprot:3564461-Prymnesium_polylepis.1